MGEERSSKKARFVQVSGFGEWKFFPGTAVGEAASYIARDRGLDKDDLAIAAVTEEGDVVAGTALPLLEDYHYVVRKTGRSGSATATGARTFAAGHAVNPREHYFLQPDVDLLLQDMKNGKYCALCGRRQSGKTTTANVVMQRLMEETDVLPVVLEGLEVAAKHWSPSDMWKYVWSCIHRSHPKHFAASPGPADGNSICLSADVRALFRKDVLNVPVALVMDEADSLLYLPTDCLHDFFHGIRSIKQRPDVYNLKSFLLIGVETVKDLLEARHGVEAGRTPSRLSSFPHDHRLAPGAFTTADIASLLEQRNAEVGSMSVVRDVQEIAASIMLQTSGHKGLVGTCLAHLVREKAFDISSWRKLAFSHKLANHVFGQATYSSMMQYFRTWASTSEEGYNLLAQFLEEGEQWFTEDAMLPIRALLAEGVLAVKEEVDDQVVVCISSPLLHSAILRKCIFEDQEVESPPDRDLVDRMWLIFQAIRTLEGAVMCRPECLRSSSEYSHQFLFISRLKAVLRGAYPRLQYVVLPEVKEVEVPGVGRSQMRLDVLVRDGHELMAFELVVNATEANARTHEEDSQKYHQQHDAQVFMINFTDRPGGVLFRPKSAGVYSLLVEFDTGKATAAVKCMDVHGKVEVHVVPLVKWTGKLSFREVV